ncbi:MAG: hypothetical protein LUE14_09185 [Clostridiales bacterium]|nr:hypothetical protein [Clostridiales bacterium]
MDEHTKSSTSDDTLVAKDITNAKAAEDTKAVENTQIVENHAYEAAKELAESYTFLLKEKESYRGRLGKYPHYTLNDAYYLLSQGPHEQAERVQTSGTSDPVSRAVMNAEKLLHRLNAEMDAEYQREVVKPYMDICEKVHLFEVCMNILSRRQYHIADQLYVQNISRKEITDVGGRHIGRRRLAQETESILRRFAEVLEQYKGYRGRGGRTQEEKEGGSHGKEAGQAGDYTGSSEPGGDCPDN